jgi:flagellar biosynthesis/type III secretory pathway M-ring protein FliF/YscJ
VEVVLAVILIAALAWFVSAPLRRRVDAAADSDELEDPRIADLEARKEAKYRQIRDAEFDRAQGKLSEEDWRRADAELRREAIEILKELDRLRG